MRLVTTCPATVGVIQTSSERDHNSDAGPEAFHELGLDRVRFEFFDEHSIGDLLRGVAERRFSAISFGSNSLFNPVIHAASQEAAAEIGAASEAGMGIVTLAPVPALRKRAEVRLSVRRPPGGVPRVWGAAHRRSRSDRR